MPELTDAQYLAAARALLGIKPEHTHLSGKFVLAQLPEVCDPAFFQAALDVAFEAGRASVGVEVDEAATTITSVEHYRDGTSEEFAYSGSDLAAFAISSSERDLADPEMQCVRVEVFRAAERTYQSERETIARLGDWSEAVPA